MVILFPDMLPVIEGLHGIGSSESVHSEYENVIVSLFRAYSPDSLYVPIVPFIPGTSIVKLLFVFTTTVMVVLATVDFHVPAALFSWGWLNRIPLKGTRQPGS
jgi:hypothetical protein